MEKDLICLLEKTKNYLTDYHRNIIVSKLSGKPEGQNKMIDFIKEYSSTDDLVIMDYLDLLVEPYTRKELAAALQRVSGMNSDLTDACMQELHNDQWKEQELFRFIKDVSSTTVEDIVEYIKGPLQQLGELRDCLKSVSDSYTDFVGAMMTYLKDDEENREKVIKYIKNNPDKKTDDILEYMDELWGI